MNIYFAMFQFKEELSRALSKAKVPVSDFSATVDNWKKVLPNIILMLGDVCALEDDIPTVNFGEYYNTANY